MVVSKAIQQNIPLTHQTGSSSPGANVLNAQKNVKERVEKGPKPKRQRTKVLVVQLKKSTMMIDHHRENHTMGGGV